METTNNSKKSCFKQTGKLITFAITSLTLVHMFSEVRAHNSTVLQREIDMTFKHYERLFKENALEESYKKVKELITDSESNFEVINLNNEQNFRNFIENLGNKNKQHILRIAYFYINVVECLEGNICHKETAKSLFREDMRQFASTFSPFLCKKAKEWNMTTYDNSFNKLTIFSDNPFLCSEISSYKLQTKNLTVFNLVGNINISK